MKIEDTEYKTLHFSGGAVTAAIGDSFEMEFLRGEATNGKYEIVRFGTDGSYITVIAKHAETGEEAELCSDSVAAAISRYRII